MLRSLERAFRAEGDSRTRFYLSFLDDAPRPDAALIQALNDGASRVIVSEVFLTISNHTAEGEELIRGLAGERFGVPVQFTGPLWDSGPLAEMFVRRAPRIWRAPRKPRPASARGAWSAEGMGRTMADGNGPGAGIP